MDPVQAANILLGVFQMLQGSAESNRQQQNGPADSLSAVPGEHQVTRRLEAIEERNSRLVLVVQAMWTLMAEKTGLTDADLIKRMTDLDGADGALDGRVTAPPQRCSCGAMVCRKMGRCLFCGKAYPITDTFHTL